MCTLKYGKFSTVYVLTFLAPREKKFDLTFQASGCPNKTPSQSQIKWWKRQPDWKVFKDMYSYCTKVRDGKAKARQIKECCGQRSQCNGISCKLQSTYVLKTGINPLVSLSYILLYIKLQNPPNHIFISQLFYF